MKRSPYEIPEPWPIRIREAMARALVCPFVGHRRPRKMHGFGACYRCGR